MKRITITVQEGIDDETAIRLVLDAVKDGKVSNSNGHPQYCHIATWKNGYVVWTRPNYGTTNPRFRVTKENK